MFTPGSWIAAGLNQTRLPPLPLAVGALENGQNKAICSIFGFADEDKANARLIAAAPALLKALEETRRGLALMLDNMPYLFPANGRPEKMTEGQRSWRLKATALAKAARAAIDKAKGE